MNISELKRKKAWNFSSPSNDLPPHQWGQIGRSEKAVANAKVSAVKSHVVVTDPRFHPQKNREISSQAGKIKATRVSGGTRDWNAQGVFWQSWVYEWMRVELLYTFVAQEPSSSSSSSSSSWIYILSSCPGMRLSDFLTRMHEAGILTDPMVDLFQWCISR